MIDVRKFGAVGDGSADDSETFQKALDSGEKNVRVPSGSYRISRTLRIHSGTTLEAAPDARIFQCGEVSHRRGDFLLTNAETETGNENIVLRGGVWDGNNTGRFNTKESDIFKTDAWSGAVLNFVNVKNLKLENLEIANSVVYHTRFSKIDTFEFRDIGFSCVKPAFNQDGLHFGGFVRNGVVENIRALSKGQTNDDMLALNADDSLKRLENFDLFCGPIENIVFRNIFAEDCYTGVRLLSVVSPIRNIRFENMNFGCRHYAVNCDAARYCRTPLFREEEYPDGCGLLENISFTNFRVHTSAPKCQEALITLESRADRVFFSGFSRENCLDADPAMPTFLAKNLNDQKIVLGNTENPSALFTLNDKRDRCMLGADFPFSEMSLFTL